MTDTLTEAANHYVGLDKQLQAEKLVEALRGLQYSSIRYRDGQKCMHLCEREFKALFNGASLEDLHAEVVTCRATVFDRMFKLDLDMKFIAGELI